MGSSCSAANEVPMRTAVLIREYGVIHIKNALTEEQRKQLWRIAKPRVADRPSVLVL